MNRRSRPPVVTTMVGAIVLPAVLLLAGCSSTTIDVPEGTQASVAAATPQASEPAPIASETPIATAAPVETTPTPAGPTEESLDCASVLPLETIESVLELPADFVTTSDQGAGCAWAMAGNPAALVLQSSTGATADTVATQEAAGAVEASDLGDQAFFRAGDAALDPAATLVVLVGDRLVSLRSYVGGQDALETLATDALTALGADPS